MPVNNWTIPFTLFTWDSKHSPQSMFNSFFWLKSGHSAKQLARRRPPACAPLPANSGDVALKCGWIFMKMKHEACQAHLCQLMKQKPQFYRHCLLFSAVLFTRLLRECGVWASIDRASVPHCLFSAIILVTLHSALFKTWGLGCRESWVISWGFMLADHRALCWAADPAGTGWDRGARFSPEGAGGHSCEPQNYALLFH